MVTKGNLPNNEVEARAGKLIHEFQDHFEEFAQAHPEHADKQREIFEAWAIQKIAGLQLSVEHISEQFNKHVQGHKMRRTGTRDPGH